MSSGGTHHGRVLFLLVMICQVMRWGGVLSLKENITTCTMPSSFCESPVKYTSLAIWMMTSSSYDWNLLLLKTSLSCQLLLLFAQCSEINVQSLVVTHWMGATLGRKKALRAPLWKEYGHFYIPLIWYLDLQSGNWSHLSIFGLWPNLRLNHF